ncbi:MAG: glycosyltransferase, partial [Bacteroidia bacterium]|nr:glycosyltransferase [Bacteroidia bacterium]MDW8333941.1 glycosyltransferase [Bacteroidia bacterium]
MHSSPFFSIVIPTYRRAHLIGKTLESFLNQTYTDFEIIVVDDGGNDNTRTVVESFGDSRIYY